MSKPYLSIIIPILNEISQLEAFLISLKKNMVFENDETSTFRIIKIKSHKELEIDGSYLFECEICDYNRADIVIIFEGPPKNLRIRWL